MLLTYGLCLALFAGSPSSCASGVCATANVAVISSACASGACKSAEAVPVVVLNVRQRSVVRYRVAVQSVNPRFIIANAKANFRRHRVCK
mgnify:CR=1 FL=1